MQFTPKRTEVTLSGKVTYPTVRGVQTFTRWDEYADLPIDSMNRAR